MEILNCFNNDFTSDPHSPQIGTILILWLLRDSGLTKSSVQDGFKAYIFASRTDFTLRLEQMKNVEIPRQLWAAAAAKTSEK